MALIVKDRVRETTTTTGAGTITLAGASTGFRSFADIGNANTTYYCISNNNEFEVGVGTYTASGTTLSRDTVLSNSLGTTAKINFSAGVKDVFCTYPSEKSILGDTSAVGSTGTGSVVLNSNPSIASGATIDATTQDINIGGSQTSGVLNLGTNTARTSNIYIGKNANNSYGISVNNFNGETQTNIDVGRSSQSLVNIGVEGSEADVASIVTVRGNVTIGDAFIPTSILGGLSLYGTLNGVVATFTNTLTGSGATFLTGSLQLLGSSTANQGIATSQTTGSLTIGGAGATGAITLGQSTSAQTVNIATGTTSTAIVNIGGAGASTGAINIGRSTGTQTVNIATGVNNLNAKTVNIGTGATNGATTITVGPTGTSSGATTINIGTQARNSNITEVNIGTNATGGNSNITLGSIGAATNITSNGIIQQRIYTGINAQTPTAGRKAFVSDHRSATAYPIFGEAYSTSGTFGPFNVPVFADGTIWRVG